MMMSGNFLVYSCRFFLSITLATYRYYEFMAYQNRGTNTIEDLIL